MQVFSGGTKRILKGGGTDGTSRICIPYSLHRKPFPDFSSGEILKLGGEVGATTFGFDRYLNQDFYKSKQWLDARNATIARDVGNDLGVEGYAIQYRPMVHHMNPMTVEDVMHGNEDILNPEYLITVSIGTHNAIHYGNSKLIPGHVVERKPGDTKLW